MSGAVQLFVAADARKKARAPLNSSVSPQRGTMRTLSTITLVACLFAGGLGSAYGGESSQNDGLKVIQIIDMQLATGEHMYILEYRTSRSIEDVAGMALEAESLWPRLRPMSEAAGHSSAGIRAVTPATGLFFKQTKAYTFIWKMTASGAWHRLQDDG